MEIDLIDSNKLAPEQKWIDQENHPIFRGSKQYVCTQSIDLEIEEKFFWIIARENWNIALEKIMAPQFPPRPFHAYCASSEADIQYPWEFHRINDPLSRDEESLITCDPHGLELHWLAEHPEILTEHSGEWIAIQGSKLLAAGKRLADVLATARAQRVVRPLVMFCPLEPNDYLLGMSNQPIE